MGRGHGNGQNEYDFDPAKYYDCCKERKGSGHHPACKNHVVKPPVPEPRDSFRCGPCRRLQFHLCWRLKQGFKSCTHSG